LLGFEISPSYRYLQSIPILLIWPRRCRYSQYVREETVDKQTDGIVNFDTETLQPIPLPALTFHTLIFILWITLHVIVCGFSNSFHFTQENTSCLSLGFMRVSKIHFSNANLRFEKWWKSECDHEMVNTFLSLKGKEIWMHKWNVNLHCISIQFTQNTWRWQRITYLRVFTTLLLNYIQTTTDFRMMLFLKRIMKLHTLAPPALRGTKQSWSIKEQMNLNLHLPWINPQHFGEGSEQQSSTWHITKNCE